MFTDIDQTCKVHVNRTGACISQYKTRQLLVFDLYYITLKFILKEPLYSYHVLFFIWLRTFQTDIKEIHSTLDKEY